MREKLSTLRNFFVGLNRALRLVQLRGPGCGWYVMPKNRFRSDSRVLACVGNLLLEKPTCERHDTRQVEAVLDKNQRSAERRSCLSRLSPETMDHANANPAFEPPCSSECSVRSPDDSSLTSVGGGGLGPAFTSIAGMRDATYYLLESATLRGGARIAQLLVGDA